MSTPTPWSQLIDEAAECFGAGFHLRAYSELMPPPWVGIKPCARSEVWPPAVGDDGLAIGEHERAHELEPGLGRLAARLVSELGKLMRGQPCELSRSLLRGNPAWPASIGSQAERLAFEPLALLAPLALSRTQDDKGRVPWTLFGASHEGPARPFWASFPDSPEGAARFASLVGWLLGARIASPADLRAFGVRVLPRSGAGDPEGWREDLPRFARELALAEGEGLEAVRAILTFEAFGRLPAPVQRGWLDGRLRLLPTPASLVFFEHAGYRRLAGPLPRATQIPLLQLFPRSETSYGIRIPQSGWLDEKKEGDHAGHRVRGTVVRTHRWERVQRDAELEPEGRFADRVTTALFSTEPDDLGLYGKPMSRNAQIWTERYEPILDGPSASPEQLQAAARAVKGGGRFGYRFFFPPMRAGARELFWHRPLAARLDPATGAAQLAPEPPLGYLTAERPERPSIRLRPVLLDRPEHRRAAGQFERDPGVARLTTSQNARKLLEWHELLGRPLPPSFARALLEANKEAKLEAWLSGLPQRARVPSEGEALSAHLRSLLGEPLPVELDERGVARSLTFEQTASRDFEERYWRLVASLSEGEWRDKDNADPVLANSGRTGGELAAKVGRAPAKERDLDRLADHLAQAHREAIARHGMEGRAFVGEHRFRWETDHEFGWSQGWRRGSTQGERNLVVCIPGRDEGQAVILADHYDTAYMENLYDPSRGGDRLRASAAGADDNHSATAALLLAAEALLPLAREGKLARSVWLVHLTGEEFPADCLGARALGAALARRDLWLSGASGEAIDLSRAEVRGAYVLDMIAHNNDRDRDVFQIAPGEGPSSAQLALLAHLANERWNRSVAGWNKLHGRRGAGRARRVESGATPPPLAEHLPLAGEVRPEWHPRSALYNTDGQIFSDLGIPVVLFMENYDIRRTGYHDVHDTLKNIDLDYGAALAAIAIEATALAATEWCDETGERAR